MTDNKNIQHDEDTREFEENPYDPDYKKPEDIVRLFYTHNVPIIPVVSKRGILIGILKKEDLISELSDIERVEKLNTDAFITKLTRKLSFDDLLPYGTIKEFVVINIFGEPQGAWSRLQLFSASETQAGRTQPQKVVEDKELENQKEEKILEWIIYLILEHIPRPIFAVNENGKTIFYNHLFEELVEKRLNSEMDIDFIEKSIKNSDKNEPLKAPKGGDLYFYNNALDFYYEKMPLLGKKKRLGFLIFGNKEREVSTGVQLPGVDLSDKGLAEMVDAFERYIIVNSIKEHKELGKSAESLGITKKVLMSRMKKHAITT